MANDKKFQVKNGLRTQNINFQSDPDSTNLITTSMIDDLDTLSISGDAGQLFSLSDDLTGSVFTVNDISGMPSIEVLASGNILLAEYEGNVGIGTTSPVAKLHIENGDMRIEKDTKATIGFRGHTAGSTALAFRDANAGVDRMTIDASGNVGIGLAGLAPAQKLDLGGVLRFTPNPADTGYSADIAAQYNSQHPFTLIVNNNSSSAEYLGVYADPGGANNRVVFPTGNVGIGTSVASRKVEIVDGSNGAIDPVLRLYNPNINSNTGAAVEFAAKNGNGIEHEFADIGAGVATGLVGAEGGYLRFRTIQSGTMTEAMRIDASGNVGINTTPKAWTAFTPVLQIKNASTGGGGALAGTSADNFRMFANTYYDGVYKRLATGFATQYAQESGAHVWSYAASGATDSTFTWSEAMRIDASGNLGINTTDIGAKLSVRADASTGVLNVLDVGNKQNAATTGDGARIRLHCTTDENRGVAIGSLSEANYAVDNSMVFYTSTASTLSEKMRINSVGTTTIKTDGTTQLVLNRADASIASGNQVANLLVTGDDPSAGQSGAAINFTAGGAWGTNSYPTNIAFYNDSAGTLVPRMTIASGGNVGIGVDNPDSLLHLKNTDADVRLTLETGESYDCYINFSGATSEASVGYDATDNALLFCNPAGDLTSNEAMRIDVDGNVGIGTSSPSNYYAKNLVVSAGAEGGVTIASTATDNTNYLCFGDGTTGTERYRGMIAYDHSDDHMAFRTLSIERMRLDEDGNILLQNGSPEFHFGTTSASHYNWRIATQEAVDKGFEIASGTTSLGSDALTDTYTTRLAILGDTGNVGLGISVPVATVHAQPTRTGVNYATVFAGGTSANSGQHGISLMTGGNALGGLLGSNLTLENLTFAQSNTGRSSGYVGFENTTTASQKSKITFGGMDRGTTTAVNTMELDGLGNLAVVGNITAYATLSDISLKENIEVIPNAVDKVKTLDGITFNYIKDGPDKRMTGVIAQQVQEVLPEAVYETEMIGDNENKNLAVRYGNMVGLLIEAIKEQQQQIDELKEIIFRGEIS